MEGHGRALLRLGRWAEAEAAVEELDALASNGDLQAAVWRLARFTHCHNPTVTALVGGNRGHRDLRKARDGVPGVRATLALLAKTDGDPDLWMDLAEASPAVACCTACRPKLATAAASRSVAHFHVHEYPMMALDRALGLLEMTAGTSRGFAAEANARKQANIASRFPIQSPLALEVLPVLSFVSLAALSKLILARVKARRLLMARGSGTEDEATFTYNSKVEVTRAFQTCSLTEILWRFDRTTIGACRRPTWRGCWMHL